MGKGGREQGSKGARGEREGGSMLWPNRGTEEGGKGGSWPWPKKGGPWRKGGQAGETANLADVLGHEPPHWRNAALLNVAEDGGT